MRRWSALQGEYRMTYRPISIAFPSGFILTYNEVSHG